MTTDDMEKEDREWEDRKRDFWKEVKRQERIDIVTNIILFPFALILRIYFWVWDGTLEKELKR